MNRRILLASLMMFWCLAWPGSAAAQSSDVTLTVPLNLTQVSSQIDKILVSCEISSSAIMLQRSKNTGRVVKWVEIPNVDGRVVTTVTVVLSLPFGSLADDARGQNANYVCYLAGYPRGESNPRSFSETDPNPALRLSPTPSAIFGSFTW
jgi:hypothetical protein